MHRRSNGSGVALAPLGSNVNLSSNPSSPLRQPPVNNHQPGGSSGGDGDSLSTLSAGGGAFDNSGGENAPAKHDFMVSFLVDARGGSMIGCRHSGLKVTIPPKSVPQPMRITCRYVKLENLLYPPKLNEGEELASRILQVGPAGSKFLGPVLIEVPHVASLRRGEREIIILRCEAATSGQWAEHRQDLMAERALKDMICESISSTSSLTSSSPSRAQNAVDTGRTVGIVARDFPQYFAVVSRSRQEVVSVGASGATLTPPFMPRVRVHIPPKALTKEVDIGISAQAIEDDVVEDILMQGGAVSPIVTIEPRRRKFHKAVTVTIPLPERLPHYNNGGGGGTARTLATATSAGSSKRTSMESLNRTIGGFSSLTPPPDVNAILPADSRSETPTGGGNSTAATAAALGGPIETTLKLVCSMSANRHKACWEDVTDTTPLTFTSGGVQFTSVVSASFWVIDCPNWMSNDVMSLVDQLYKSTIRVPYLAKFYLYARRGRPDVHHQTQADSSGSTLGGAGGGGSGATTTSTLEHQRHQTSLGRSSSLAAGGVGNDDIVTMRALCLTEPDRAEHPLELQEDFGELCRSEYVEIFDRTEISVRFSGNLLRVRGHDGDDVPEATAVTTTGSVIASGLVDDGVPIVFRPFSDNRQTFTLRRRNDKNPYPKGRVTFYTGVGRTLYEAKVDLTKFL